MYMEKVSASSDSVLPLRPFLKWPGGKRDLLKHITPMMPASFNRYLEPFVGGGAVFFALQPQKAILADRNAELIQCYTQVRDHPTEVINCLKQMPNSKDDYYRIRGVTPISEAERAARFIYLVTLSFNGIYRVNLRGEFNVPYGYKTQLIPCQETAINTASRALSNVVLRTADFGDTLAKAKKDDFIYLDPPYTVAHSNNGFLKYNARIFSWDDQKKLAKVALKLATKGCHVIVSNADHPEIHKLYKDFSVRIIERPSVIAASKEYRRKVKECLFYKE